MSHDLREFKVISPDSPDVRALCSSNRFFGLQISDSKVHRSLYFVSYEQMTAAAGRLICGAQRFSRRVDQYELIRAVPESVVIPCHLVRHRVTREKFFMKKIAFDELDEIKEQGHMELLALQKTFKWPETIGLLDRFTDSDGSVVFVTKKPSSTTLADYVRNVHEKLPLKVLTSLIKSIAGVIVKLHRKRIIHRDIRLENICIKQSKNKRENGQAKIK